MSNELKMWGYLTLVVAVAIYGGFLLGQETLQGVVCN